MVQTPKGIMYLIKIEKGLAYCYDDQTGKNEVFSIEEVSGFNIMFPLHKFIIKEDNCKEYINVAANQ